MDLSTLMDNGGIRLKRGVKLTGIQPGLVLGIVSTAFIFLKFGQTLWITSANDSRHGRTSLHWSGNAVDVRSRVFNDEEIDQVMQLINTFLGEDFDVLLEHRGQPNEHIHIEYQPRGG